MTTLKSSLWFSGQRPLEQFITSIILPLTEKFMLLCEMVRAEATATEQVYARSGGIFIKLRGADCRFPLTLPAQTAAPPAPTIAPANPGCHSTTDFTEIKVVQCWNPKNPFPWGGKYPALVGWYDKGYKHGLCRARTAASHCKPVCKALQLTGVYMKSTSLPESNQKSCFPEVSSELVTEWSGIVQKMLSSLLRSQWPEGLVFCSSTRALQPRAAPQVLLVQRRQSHF